MGCVRKRRGAWVVDYRVHGKRIVKAYRTRREAEVALATIRGKADEARRLRPAVDPFITLRDFVPHFLADCREAEVAPATLHRYERTLANHVLPTLGARPVRDIARGDVRALVMAKRAEGANLQGLKGDARRVGKGTLKRNTVKQIRSVLSAVLACAVDLEVVGSNVALGVFRQRKTKAARKAARARAGETVKAMTLEQRNAFLATAARVTPGLYPAFLLMALAGLRLGEALGLKWAAVNFADRTLDVREQVRSDSTKSGEARVVDMATVLVECLASLEARRRREAFAQGFPMSPWVVFQNLSEKPTRQEAQAAEKRVRRGMERALRAAGLPPWHTPHSLRHTFCSLLIAADVSPVYVQQQAGHASVEMTVAVYGSWFAQKAPGAMDRLAAGLAVTNGAEPVTSVAPPSPQPLAPTGTYGSAAISRPFPG
jgi:integrase